MIVVLIILFIGFRIYTRTVSLDNTYNQNGTQNTLHDGVYTIAGQKVILKNGISEIESAPGSATKIVTRYFGNDIVHDLNNDGREDRVFMLTQETGGSGMFFYVVAALNTPDGNVGSHGFLLGDRILPQSIDIDEGITTQGTTRKNVIVVNFATREPHEAFTVQPTLTKSVWIKLDPETMQFGEVVQNFEGESR